MTTFAQDKGNYDILLGPDGQLATVDGRKAYANIISDTLRTIRGECPVDVDMGMPWLPDVLGQSFRIQEWIGTLQSIVLSFDFVRSISAFDYTFDSRSKTISYRMTIITDLGDMEIES